MLPAHHNSPVRNPACSKFRFVPQVLWGLVACAVLNFCGCGVGLSSNGVENPVPGATSSGSSVGLAFSTGVVDFGSTAVGAVSTIISVQLTNSSNLAASLSSFITDNGAFAVTPGTCGAQLAPKASCSLGVSFRPTAPGVQTGTADLTSNGKTFALPLKGTGVKGVQNDLRLDPSSASFPDTLIGTTSGPLVFEVTNAGTATVAFSSPTVGTGFVIESTTCGTALLPAAACTVNVAFAPTTLGSIEAAIAVESGGSAAAAHVSGIGGPHSLLLTIHNGQPALGANIRSGGAPLQFAASLDGGPTTGIRWSLQTPALGAIESGLYTPPKSAPSGATDGVVATLLSDPSIKAVATIVISPPAPTLSLASPSSVIAGASTVIHLTGNNLGDVKQVTANGLPIAFTVLSSTELTTSLSPRLSDGGSVSLVADSGDPAPGGSNLLSIPVTQPLVSFDAAVRFSQQAGFGPTVDQVSEIQNRGFSGWIDWQLGNAPYDYVKDAGMDYGVYMANTQASSLALRQRVSLALREIYTFGYSPACYAAECGHYWEATIERDAFGNIRNLMNDVALSPLMGTFLNNAINFDGWPYNFTANQNFAREFLQLMTIGPNVLTADGTVVVGSDGLPLNTYTEDNIINMAAALSGWTFSKPDGTRAYYLADPMKPMQAQDGAHNMKRKVVLPGVTLPAGNTAPADLAAVLDALYRHPNMGPFLSKQLIQHLVSSNPSRAYVGRVAAIFDDNGVGVKGDLSAVVRAILLDPEARRGDDPKSGQTQDAHVMEPILYMAHIMNLIGGVYTDDRVYISMNPWGEEVLMEPTVFGYFSPNNALADGTLSPEAQLLNNNAAMAKIGFLNSILHGSLPGLAINLQMSPLWKVSDSTDLVNQMDHWLFHGAMSAGTRNALTQYASDHSSQSVHDLLPNMLLIGLSSSSFQVIH